jgi:hypothetical protein
MFSKMSKFAGKVGDMASGAADVVKETAGVIADIGGKLAKLSPADMAQAMKDALVEGISYAIEKGSEPGYFSEREDIKIRFPEPLLEAKNITIEGKIRMIPGQSEVVDQFLVDLNYAAEQSTGVCRDIFEDAVKGMSFSKCKELLLSKNKRAVTEYLEETCGDEIRAACKGPIDEVCEQDSIRIRLKIWETLQSAYNALPLVTDIDFDVRQHVVEQTVHGIMVMIAEKEVEIRENPMSFAQESIQGVFGAAKEAFDDYTQQTDGLKDRFKGYDTNGDGFLSLDEIEELLLKGDANMSKSELKTLFIGIDKNKDGKVCLNEFIDYIHEN